MSVRERYTEVLRQHTRLSVVVSNAKEMVACEQRARVSLHVHSESQRTAEARSADPVDALLRDLDALNASKPESMLDF